MKKKLVETIDAACLSEFVFGDPEAKTDDLLVLCPQLLRGVQEFLHGKKVLLSVNEVSEKLLFSNYSAKEPLGLPKIHTKNNQNDTLFCQ